MSNVYYSASGNPATGAAGTSATIRAEFNAIVAAFDKMPTPTGNAGKHLLVDPSGTSLTVSSAITESAGVVTITGATVLDATANIAGSALVTLAASQTLTNKTLTAPVIATINNGGTLTLPTGPQTLVGRTTTDTLTNKTLTNPVINGFTGDTSAINIGSGQIVKDTAGNLGVNTSPQSRVDVKLVTDDYTALANTFSIRGAVNSGINFAAHNDAGGAGVDIVSRGYSATQGDFRFISANGSYAGHVERMRLDSSGNLLVGATAQVSGERVRIESTSAGGVPNTLRLTNAGTTSGTGANLSFVSYTNATAASTIASISGISSDTSGNGLLAFNTSGSEKMRVDASGRLIVGGTSAAARIHSVVADGTQAFGVTGTTKGLRINTDSNKVNIQGVDSTLVGTYQPIAIGGSTVTLQYNGTTDGLLLDAGGNIGISKTPSAWGSGYNAIQTKGGSLYSGTTGNMVVGQNYYFDGTNFRYSTANPATYYLQSGGTHAWGYAASGVLDGPFTFTEVARIDTVGTLRINNTSGVPNPGIAAYAAGYLDLGNNNQATGWGFINFCRNGALIANITQSGTTAVAYNTTSDERLKENVTPSPDAGNIIDAINIVSYDWKSDGSHVDYGVIAQQLHSVFPSAVTPGDEDRPWGWDSSFLVPLLVKEIQALRSRVSALECA